MNTKLIARRYLRIIKNWLWLIVLGGLLAGGADYFLNTTTPKYQATTTVIVGQLLQQAVPDQNEAPLIERLSSYYLELLRRQPVVDRVKNKLQLTNIPDDKFLESVATQIVPQTSIIEIKVTNSDPNQAVKIANTFAQELIKQSPTAPDNQQKEQRDFIQNQLQELQTQIQNGQKSVVDLNQMLTKTTNPTEVTDLSMRIKTLQTQLDTWQSNYTALLRQSTAASPNTLSVLEEAKQAVLTKDLTPLIRTILLVLAGIIAAVVFAIVMEYLDDRIKHPEDITYSFKLSVLAQLPPVVSPNHAENQKRQQKSAQAYELFSTSLLFSENFDEQRRSLLITAPSSLEEQERVVIKLAHSLINFGQSLLLIDANLRKPKLHKMLLLSDNTGFYDIFYGKTNKHILDTIYSTKVPNLSLMPAGNVPSLEAANTNFPTGAKHIYELLDNYKAPDILIFNSDSILEDKTSRLLAAHTGGVVLLCKLKATRKQELRAAVEVIERLRGNLLGVAVIERTSFLSKLFASKGSKHELELSTLNTTDLGSAYPNDIYGVPTEELPIVTSLSQRKNLSKGPVNEKPISTGNTTEQLSRVAYTSRRRKSDNQGNLR